MAERRRYVDTKQFVASGRREIYIDPVTFREYLLTGSKVVGDQLVTTMRLTEMFDPDAINVAPVATSSPHSVEV